MTGRGALSGTTNTVSLDYRELPLDGHLRSAFILGDLVVAVANWARAQRRAMFAVRDDEVAGEPPSAPCSAF